MLATTRPVLVSTDLELLRLFARLSETLSSPCSQPFWGTSKGTRSRRKHLVTQTQTRMTFAWGALVHEEWRSGSLSISAHSLCQCKLHKLHRADWNLQQLTQQETSHPQHWERHRGYQPHWKQHWKTCPSWPRTHAWGSFCPKCGSTPMTEDLACRILHSTI